MESAIRQPHSDLPDPQTEADADIIQMFTERQEQDDFASERIVREAHPILFDTASSAEDFWKEDLADDAVVIRNASNYDQDYPNAYLILDCFKTEDGAVVDSEQITAIHIPNYKELGIDYPRPSGTPALRKGNKGSEVGWLQTALNKAMSAYLTVDCSYGAGTEEKVREFQSRCRLGVDGTAGPKTIAELVEIVSGRKPMPEKVVETESPRIRIAPEPDPPADTPSYTPSVSNNTGSGSYLLNTKTGVYHNSESCPAARRMSEENKLWISWSEAQAYTPCGKCVS